MNKTDILPYDFNGNDVTTITDRDGNPWWVAKEVCEILGLCDNGAGAGQYVRRLDYDEWKTITLTKNIIKNHVAPEINKLQPRKYAIVNESGLYSLILRSNKPEAKAFQRWVTHEVLPSIRKTGKYQFRNMTEEEKLLAIADDIVKQRQEIRLLEGR